MHMLGLLCVGIEKKIVPPHCFWGFNMRFVIVLFFYPQKVVVFFDLYNPWLQFEKPPARFQRTTSLVAWIVASVGSRGGEDPCEACEDLPETGEEGQVESAFQEGKTRVFFGGGWNSLPRVPYHPWDDCILTCTYMNGWFLYFFMVNVRKYTRPMDGIGVSFNTEDHGIFQTRFYFFSWEIP